ncbi:dihydrolipoamide dehydrogenase [Marinicauda salina]|uniref:Dihydrolipoamide dehydrogenase n=1 Tax=Marinicauda salina TaxID=2135793 RepID=A0A2U2BXR9_9PROT|nr:FAD-dependent oxidoreductase [Marinicauda salina]PWE18806.1 dihydrolipoamide dehydrogenase [Marinicauda salina]
MKADLCVIGAGAAGLVSSSGAAMLGRKVVLFEAGEMGGDCLNYGCVPSKALLTAADVAHQVRTAGRFGVNVGEPEIDFAAVRAHVRGAIEAIHPNDSQERFEGMGVTVIRERARFIDPQTVASNGYEVKAKRFVLATGTRPRVPPVAGLAELTPLTSETIWDLETLPEHLLVLGGGPIGCELGQAFARLGSQVTIVEAGAALARFEPVQAAVVKAALTADGVDLQENARVERAESGGGGVRLQLADGRWLEGSHVLAAAGREPVTEGLGLSEAGIETDDGGVVCDDKLRTTNRRVYAAGDIAGKGALTHLAGWHGSVILRNLYFGLPTRQSSAPIPQAVYTDPPLAAIGLTEAAARERHGDAVDTARWGFDDNDRAICEGRPEGEAKLVVGKGGALLGVHVVGERADDIVQIASATMQKGGKVRELTEPVAPYPTRGEILKRAAGAHFEPVVFGRFAKAWAGLLSAFH